MEDKGTYHCKAEIEPTKHINATVKVIVYGEYNALCNALSNKYTIIWYYNLGEFFFAEHPFLNISYGDGRSGIVKFSGEGGKIVLEPRVNALPPPDKVDW